MTISVELSAHLPIRYDLKCSKNTFRWVGRVKNSVKTVQSNQLLRKADQVLLLKHMHKKHYCNFNDRRHFCFDF